MALRGTLETFSVPEVLRLLSSTRKTGLMALGGDRGTGKVWLEEGQIIAAESDQDTTGEVGGVLFDLLHFEVGEFVFEAETAPARPGWPVDVDEALGRAEALLGEWHDLEALVPSLAVGVRLRREIDGPVTVTSEQWTSLVAIGGGTTAEGLGAALGLGEFDTCRHIRDLVEATLVEITDEELHSESDVDTKDVMAQLSGLSPKAAAAIEATSDTDDATERSRLLEFVSSTKDQQSRS